MNRVPGRVLTAIIGIFFASLLAWALQEAREHSTEKQEAERAENPASRLSTQGGEALVSLDASTEARIGLRVATLQAATRRQDYRVTAVVLSAQELTELRKSYLAARTELDKAKAATNVSKQEYDRLDSLHRQDQNASTKAVQAAEAAWRTDEANLQAVQNSLLLSELATRQGWGDVIARWLIDGSPGFTRILEQKDVLLQISVPQALGGNAPGTAFLETPNGKTEGAKRLSAFPRVDPRLQTPSFLYTTPSRPDFVPGMTLGALLPSGPAVKGVSVPSKAVIWLQGKAWAYVQAAQGKFLRREVSTRMPVETGWLVTEGFSPGDRIVVTGAQQLLSEEFRSQTHVIGEQDEN